MLVDYSDSDEEVVESHPSSAALPALPSGFRDLYSSTVRTSIQDDPSLHGGRTRAVPHVEGNWPTHVYLEWSPNAQELETLSSVLVAVRDGSPARTISSLMHNSLGVEQPLHISLSRPLLLKTAQKDAFIPMLKQVLTTQPMRAIDVSPRNVRWHLNEDGSRDFLVLQIASDSQLSMLLRQCNDIAARFDQPLLYTAQQSAVDTGMSQGEVDQFHVSVAWALPSAASDNLTLSEHLKQQLRGITLTMIELKIRIGQDVTTLPFKQANTSTSSLFS